MGKYLWLLVTPDEYELPLYSADSARELTEFCGVEEVTVRTMALKYDKGIINKSKFIRVKLDDDLADELNDELRALGGSNG